MYKKIFKRVFDIVISSVAIILLLPLYFLIGLIVRIQMGSPVFFSQDRIGKNEKVFRLYKFRSMTEERDKEGKLLNEQLRLTKFGIALRSSSLDEIPEFFCILKGDMSLVGPRPLPVYYGPYFYKNERVRHSIRGGLIPPDGLCGRTTPSWETQFKYDCYYAENVSLFLDLKIIFATSGILIKRINNNYGADDRPHLNEYRKEKIKEDSNL